MGKPLHETKKLDLHGAVDADGHILEPPDLWEKYLEPKPSDYFRTRVWISCDPDERTIPALADRFGADRFMWASDFPHADHTPEYIEDLSELARSFPDERSRRLFLGDNARQLYAI